jgi:hypothetical protein
MFATTSGRINSGHSIWLGSTWEEAEDTTDRAGGPQHGSDEVVRHARLVPRRLRSCRHTRCTPCDPDYAVTRLSMPA